MDAQEQLILESEIAMGVLGKGDEFILVPLDGPIEAATMVAVARGFVYSGTFTVTKHGESAALFEPDLESAHVMLCASFAFARLIADRLRPQSKDDFAQFAERMWSLEDPRGA